MSICTRKCTFIQESILPKLVDPGEHRTLPPLLGRNHTETIRREGAEWLPTEVATTNFL